MSILPNEIVLVVLSYFTCADLIMTRSVSRMFYEYHRKHSIRLLKRKLFRMYPGVFVRGSIRLESVMAYGPVFLNLIGFGFGFTNTRPLTVTVSSTTAPMYHELLLGAGWKYNEKHYTVNDCHRYRHSNGSSIAVFPCRTFYEYCKGAIELSHFDGKNLSLDFVIRDEKPIIYYNGATKEEQWYDINTYRYAGFSVLLE